MTARMRYAEELVENVLKIATEISYEKSSEITKMFVCGSSMSSKTIWKHAQDYGAKAEYVIANNTTGSKVGVTDSTKVKAGNKDTHKRGLDAHIIIACDKSVLVSKNRRSIKKTLVAFTVGSGLRHFKEQLKKTKIEFDLMIMDGDKGSRSAIRWRWPKIDMQRCLWHLWYQMGYFLWKDKVPLKERGELIEELKNIVYSKKISVITLKKYYRLIAQFINQIGCTHTASYLLNALPDVFTFRKRTRKIRVGRWISQMLIERLMREVNRRADVGRRWTDEGADNILRLRILKMLHKDKFEQMFRPKSHCSINMSILQKSP